MNEPRFGESRCPACGTGLLPIATVCDDAPLTTGERGAPISACPSCRGVWFDWWAGETATLARELLALLAPCELPRPTGVRRSRDAHCPRDRTPLVAQAYLDCGPVVGRCPRCMGLFARRAQLDELARFGDRLPDPPPPIEDRTVLSRLWRLLQ